MAKRSRELTYQTRFRVGEEFQTCDAWFKVTISANESPACFLPYCDRQEFYIHVLKGQSPKSEAAIHLRDFSSAAVLAAFQDAGGDNTEETAENMGAFKFYLRQLRYQAPPDAKTFADCCRNFPIFYHILSIERASDCEACRLHEPGLMAHMGVGGCAYDPELC